MPSRGLALAALVSVLVFALGCKPVFQPVGNLTVAGKAFRPTACHVRTGCPGGIDLVDQDGRRLELTIPPQPLRAWQTIGGTAEVRWTLTSLTSPVALGPCGTLTLRGEGYHGGGKRAASGRLSVACAGSPSVAGDLEFSGCF